MLPIHCDHLSPGNLDTRSDCNHLANGRLTCFYQHFRNSACRNDSATYFHSCEVPSARTGDDHKFGRGDEVACEDWLMTSHQPPNQSSLIRSTLGRSMNLLRRFFRSEDGPAAVEYAIVLALIVVMSVTSISRAGTKVRRDYQTIRTRLP